ncbi:beta-galactosidase trimerization domain-containing protein [Pinibacter soli]|uniref:Beta-galactosidase trimerization domain-containing protein n=1 Tax=Pinibacter soli TaxID=3044211 RepID=A0ABT6R728_9BACT|nr:beta-galactosidase trimerization domain-containing protein [Pinibacter soli]MDI3318371.1 beta-galactosidase trimerization domain-containing protein [Pinibacter soli]
MKQRSMKKITLSLTKIIIAGLLTVLICSGYAKAQTSMNDVPMIGAEVFIEPGQTPEEIDGWFKSMKNAGMSVTRIRMFESYMHKPDGSWDYSLFDLAFKAGEKYNIKIYANLFPATAFTDVGGFKFPKSDENLAAISNYIKHVANHFKQFTSLYGWVPVNEPGNGAVPNDSFAKNVFYQWKTSQRTASYNSNGYPVFDFSDQRFLVYYNVWFLDWLVKEIHKYDPTKPIHVNNHDIFKNVAEYDFPQWRKFLTSLGGSAHASWHFNYFDRRQFAMAMSANSEIIRSGAGDLPWLMTEIQGGNNVYSGGNPMCPTKEETSQWLWTTIGTGSKGAIFWCLNPRSSGFEAGEWAMLDFQDKPSERMEAAAVVAKVIDDNKELFARARVAESGISILYSREALWVEKKLLPNGSKYEARDVGGVMKSALGYFETLSQMGVQVSLQEMGEYDFSKENYTGKVIILSHQISIASSYWPQIKNFVSKGGKLIVDGLTAYYDENAHCILRQGFPLQDLFGGDIKEFQMMDTAFAETIDGVEMPACLWRGSIFTQTGKVAGISNGDTIAVFNKYGKGHVIWVPSMLGFGARCSKDYAPLSHFLQKELSNVLATQPIMFNNIQPQLLMKTLRSGNSYITVIINKSKETKTIALKTTIGATHPQLLFNDRAGSLQETAVTINPEGTMVIKW